MEGANRLKKDFFWWVTKKTADITTMVIWPALLTIELVEIVYRKVKR